MTPATYPTPLYPADYRAIEPTEALRASAERAAIERVVEAFKADAQRA